ncbi:MAG TPA: DUF6134 family protein [Rhizomicrobium sp.]|nr:DUF6134 family protein [Rhizomicrobium sp.]
MLARNAFLGALAVFMALVATSAYADSGAETIKFAVTRDDTPIGTNTIDVIRKGAETSVQIVTHVAVGMAFFTLYKFDQTETEQWTNGHLLAMNAITDDNGTLHHTNASSRDGRLVVDGDGQVQNLASTIVPASLWNPAMLSQTVALNPEDGKVVPVSVVDCGEDNLTIAGRLERTHHYLLRTIFSQDVWYDDSNRLVKMELKGADGSTIRYQLI